MMRSESGYRRKIPESCTSATQGSQWIPDFRLYSEGSGRGGTFCKMAS